MRYFVPVFALLLHGCLYFNDKGISSHLYDNCREYYDECGIYHKECPKNLVDYTEIQKGIIKTGKELKEYFDPSHPCVKKAIHESQCPPK